VVLFCEINAKEPSKWMKSGYKCEIFAKNDVLICIFARKILSLSRNGKSVANKKWMCFA